MFEVRHLHEDGSLGGSDWTEAQVVEYLRKVVPTFFYNGRVTRLTIDTAFGTIEIIPQGGLSLLTE
jgi:hypothetical protein